MKLLSRLKVQLWRSVMADSPGDAAADMSTGLRIEKDAYYRIQEIIGKHFLVGKLHSTGKVDFSIKLRCREGPLLHIQLKSTDQKEYATFKAHGATFEEYAATCDVLIFTWQADRGRMREKFAVVPLRSATVDKIGPGWPLRSQPPSADCRETADARKRLSQPHFSMDHLNFREEFGEYMLDGTGGRAHVYAGLSSRLRELLGRKQKAGHAEDEEENPGSLTMPSGAHCGPAPSQVTRSKATVDSVELPIGKPRGKGKKRTTTQANETENVTDNI